MTEVTDRPLTDPTIGRPEVKPSILTPEAIDNHIRATQMTYSALSMLPNHKEGIRETYQDTYPLIGGLVADAVSGRRTHEEVSSTITEMFAIEKEEGKKDSLSDELKKDWFLNSLQKSIDFVTSPHRLGSTVDELEYTIDLFYLDLVNFKRINDTYGQKMGDYVIQEAKLAFREDFPNSENFIGGRVGDEIVFYVVRPKNEPLNKRALHEDPTIPPPELLTVGRSGSADAISVFYHVGVTSLDPTKHFTERIESPDGKVEVITGAQKMWNEVEDNTSQRKDENKKNFPDLYLDRHAIKNQVDK